MKLQQLSLRNFKGLREYILKPEGKDISIYGDNATGKTTLMDSFTWLLFNKDSQNKVDFEIKTLGANGEPQHGLEHEVEGVLDMGGKILTLRKVYSENWTKKRGSATKEFTGHTTDHFIDGIPVKKNEYESRIASILDEDIAKLLTSPRYFNEVLHWQERRKILLEVCGDVSDEEVIVSDDALARLPDILNGRKLEDHRKVVMARRSEINKELELVPVRIDEAQRGLPQTEKRAEELIPFIALLRRDSSQISQRIATMEAGGEIAEKTKELREVESELLGIPGAYRVRYADNIQQAKIDIRKFMDESSKLETTIKQGQQLVHDNEGTISKLETNVDQLRQKWTETYNHEFTFEQDDTCPACGQALPEAKLAAARDKALANYNAHKSQVLEDIDNEGKLSKKSIEEMLEKNTQTEQLITENKSKWAEVGNKITAAEKAVATWEKQEKDYAMDEDYLRKQDQKEAIEKQIEILRTKGADAINEVRFTLQEKDAHISECETALAEIQQREKGLERIEALKAQEKHLATEYEALEQELYLTEQFVKTKVKLLEGNINSKFLHARFKLFEEQVNGAIAECCNTTFQGIPYNSALNNSSRINIGLDIINTLSAHFSFAAPIWMDNAEAVTKLLPTRGQQIKLYVSEADKVLRIENKEDN